MSWQAELRKENDELRFKNRLLNDKLKFCIERLRVISIGSYYSGEFNKEWTLDLNLRSSASFAIKKLLEW